MESVFTRPGGSHLPGVYLGRAGSGRVAYFPGDVDRTFWEVLNVDHAKLLRNAVEWATNEAPFVTVDGKGMLDLAVWKQASSMTLHLVNLTNPMMLKGPVREIDPIPGQKISLHIPAGKAVSRVHLLVAARHVPYRTERDTIFFETPAIGLHEVAAIDFSA